VKWIWRTMYETSRKTTDDSCQRYAEREAKMLNDTIRYLGKSEFLKYLCATSGRYLNQIVSQ
jgi:hypothetical protein